VAASVPVIVSPLSHCYLDVPYAEPSADPRQAERQGRVGQQVYSPKTIAEFVRLGTGRSAWAGRVAHVAGVEAAIWAVTISDFDDLCFLLLPRLAGVAHKGWSDPQVATWTDHREGIIKLVATAGDSRNPVRLYRRQSQRSILEAGVATSASLGGPDTPRARIADEPLGLLQVGFSPLEWRESDRQNLLHCHSAVG